MGKEKFIRVIVGQSFAFLKSFSWWEALLIVVSAIQRGRWKTLPNSCFSTGVTIALSPFLSSFKIRSGNSTTLMIPSAVSGRVSGRRRL